MIPFDFFAAHANEGIHPEMCRRYMPKMAVRDLATLQNTFRRLYVDLAWEERVRESSPPERRSSIAWPVKRISNIIPLRRRASVVSEPVTLGDGFWSL